MEMKVLCSIFFVTFAPLVFSAGKSKSECVTQCNYLVARFGRRALRKEFDWKQEMRIICKEKSSLSISIVNIISLLILAFAFMIYSKLQSMVWIKKH